MKVLSLLGILFLFAQSPVIHANQCMNVSYLGIEEMVEDFEQSGKINRLLSIDIFYEGLVSKQVGNARISSTVENDRIKSITLAGEFGVLSLNEEFRETISIDDLMAGYPISVNLAYGSPALLTIRPMDGFSDQGGDIALELRTTSGNKTINLSLQKIGNRYELLKVSPNYYERIKVATVGINGLSLEDIRVKSYKFR